jgi:hypothetical protein
MEDQLVDDPLPSVLVFNGKIGTIPVLAFFGFPAFPKNFGVSIFCGRGKKQELIWAGIFFRGHIHVSGVGIFFREDVVGHYGDYRKLKKGSPSIPHSFHTSIPSYFHPSILSCPPRSIPHLPTRDLLVLGDTSIHFRGRGGGFAIDVRGGERRREEGERGERERGRGLPGRTQVCFWATNKF